MVGCVNVFRDQAMGRVYQNIPHDLCHALWVGGDVGGGRWLAKGEDFCRCVDLSGGGENGGDGVQPDGRLEDGHEKSEDGWASWFGFEGGGLGDDGVWVGFAGGWGVAFEPAMFDVKSSGAGDCLFLFADEEVYLGVARVSWFGVGDSSGGGVVGGEGSVRFVGADCFGVCGGFVGGGF